MKKQYLLFLVVFIVNTSFAQEGEVKGTTITDIPGIKKSLASVLAQEKAHPLPPTFVAALRPDLKGPVPYIQDPLSTKASQGGSLVSGTTSNSAVSSVISSSAYSNFLTIWGSYSTIAGQESPYTPPDNCGDVGFTQIIATANCRMKVFNKPSVTGLAATTPTNTNITTLTPVINVDLNVFFSNPGFGISGISDPHVRFDRLSGRWFIVAIDINHKTNNYCCVAISDAGATITPATNFTIYYFNVSQTGGSSSDFYDYPTLGVDRNYLYIGGNMFARGRSFSGSNLWVVNKASLIAGTSPGNFTVTGFPHGVTNTDMYKPQGVHNDDESASEGYFIGASQKTSSKLVIRRVIYGTTPTISADLPLLTIMTYSPKTVPTLGGTTIDGNDIRLCAAMIKKNIITGGSSMWIAQGTLLNSSGIGGSGGDRDGAFWAEIGSLTTTPTILQSAMLYDGTNPTSLATYYTYPTIASNGQGNNLMGFTSAGPNQYCQAASASRFRTDAYATFNSPKDFTNTTSTYSPGAARWGDYTQTVVDPEDNMTMWTFTEYAPTTNAWGVRAGQFKAPPPAQPSLASTLACGTSTVIINGTSTNHSEFFEPGISYTKHLTVNVSGPSIITVSNVVFVSPTQITASFNLTGAFAGTYKVYVTNPDGQKDSTTFNLSSSCSAVARFVNNNVKNKTGIDTKNIIYPNPAHDEVNLINKNSGQSIIQLMDHNGRLLQVVRSSSTNLKLNVSNLSSGMYFIKIITGNKVELQKFIKN